MQYLPLAVKSPVESDTPWTSLLGDTWCPEADVFLNVDSSVEVSPMIDWSRCCITGLCCDDKSCTLERES